MFPGIIYEPNCDGPFVQSCLRNEIRASIPSESTVTPNPPLKPAGEAGQESGPQGDPPTSPLAPSSRRLGTMVLAAFVLTFPLARLMVLLIMTHRIPSLYLHLGGTHVHHLNYGIFLLSAFAVVFGDSLRYAERRLSPVFQQIEASSPPQPASPAAS